MFVNSHTTEVGSSGGRQKYLDKVSVLVIGGMLVVSPKRPGCTVAGSGLLYCSARLTKLACCPFTCSHEHWYWWASIKDWTRLSQVKDLHYTEVVRDP